MEKQLVQHDFSGRSFAGSDIRFLCLTACVDANIAAAMANASASSECDVD